jgi:hypothetical protein
MSSLAARRPATRAPRNCVSLPALLHAFGAEALDLQEPEHGKQIVHMAAFHRVQPLLHRALHDAAVELAPPAQRELDEAVRENLFRNLNLCRELLRVVQRLREAGILALPFKGPALSAMLWGSPELRQSVDLDVLALPEQLRRALPLVASLGYKPLLDLANGELARHMRIASELQFDRSDSQVLLELQWRIARRCNAISLEVPELWTRLQRQTFCGEQIAALSPEDLLLVLCVHGWRHAWSRLAWVADVAQLVCVSEIDWEVVWRRAEEHSLRRITQIGLALAHRQLGVAAPGIEERIAHDATIARLVTDITARQRRCEETGDNDWHRFTLAARDSSGDRLRQLTLFTFGSGLGEREVVHLPRALAPFYFLVRAGRLTARAARLFSPTPGKGGRG